MASKRKRRPTKEDVAYLLLTGQEQYTKLYPALASSEIADLDPGYDILVSPGATKWHLSLSAIYTDRRWMGPARCDSWTYLSRKRGKMIYQVHSNLICRRCLSIVHKQLRGA